MFEKEAFPNSVKNYTRSQPVETNVTCIISVTEEARIAATCRSFLLAELRACMLRGRNFIEENRFSCTMISNFVSAIIGKQCGRYQCQDLESILLTKRAHGVAPDSSVRFFSIAREPGIILKGSIEIYKKCLMY